jgi:hypothetical protein
MSEQPTLPNMPKIKDIPVKPSPLVGDNPPTVRSEFDVLMDAARDAMVEPDPCRGEWYSRSAQATQTILVSAVKHQTN